MIFLAARARLAPSSFGVISATGTLAFSVGTTGPAIEAARGDEVGIRCDGIHHYFLSLRN
jgi:hypothetical protein